MRKLYPEGGRAWRARPPSRKLCQLEIAGVQLRVIPARFGDARLQIIRNNGADGAAIPVQRIDAPGTSLRALDSAHAGLVRGRAQTATPKGTQTKSCNRRPANCWTAAASEIE
jgi:hypothetical protein